MDVVEKLTGAEGHGAGTCDDEPLKLLSGPPSEQLRALMKADFEWQLQDNPEFATQAGFHQHDSMLQKLSPQSWDDRLEHNKEVCNLLAQIDTGCLSDTERLYASLFKDAIDSENRGIELGGHLMPLNSIGNGGIHESFLEQLEWMRLETEEDFKDYLDRLMSFWTQVGEFCDLLAYGVGLQGRSASKSMMRRVPERLRELINSELSELRAPMEGKTLSDELRERIDQGIENCFKRGLERLLNFIEEYYGSRVRVNPAACSLKKGEELYAECLRFHTTTAKTANEIHELGLKEVARIEGRFQSEVLDVLGFTGTFTEFAKSLKADPTWFYTSEQDLLDGYKALVANIEAELPKYFGRLPKMALEVVPKQSGPCAYYYAGTADGTRPGRFYVNVSRLNERPKYEMVALALHEGVPGHHLQGAIALETEELPDFLRYIEDRRYEFCPARRPLYTGYLEGWALYCEHLGEEMGLYKTPQDLFGRLSMEMMRAVRLVVDTGIHAKGWSIEKASEYMEEKTGMASAECSEECHRYAAWPGQACGYKVGQFALEEMRSRAQEALGEKFTLPAFHEEVVGSGPLPLEALSNKIDAWIKRESDKK
eukprot:TRINITY_DN20897_c0_g1_i1.p1 TRINITY_DN20897_c0_g1~~TRINITY_DN20897_c0_g1_i1.p1  ORF type:complete len:616 (+),score=119.60 TRINITY_DN20897_c0_g1_i1:60-1850(+)